MIHAKALEIETKELTIRTCSSKFGPNELMEKIKTMQGKSSVLQIFAYESVINDTHLIGAYVNALIAFQNGTNMARSVPMEMLLFAGMTKQISEAIENVGVKSSRIFVLFSNNAACYKKLKGMLETDVPFKVSAAHKASCAAKFGIGTGPEMDKAILQKMTATRLED